MKAAPIVCLNGRFVPGRRATVSVFDRGFMYGDGLFETMRAYTGRIFALDEHMDRLRASAQFFAIPLPRYDWDDLCHELLRRNRSLRRDAWVRLMVTRGISAPTLLPATRPRPTVVITTGVVDRRDRARTAAAVLLPFVRAVFLAEHKSLNYLTGVFGKGFARRHGADEGIYVGADGFVREGITSTVFAVRKGRLVTPPARGILPGVTRRHVIALARGAGIPVVERKLRATELANSDEAFLSASVAEITPLVRVDRAPIGTGKPGPITERLQRLYRQSVSRTLPARP